MSKKIIIAIIVLLLLLGVVGYFIISSKTGPQGDGGAAQESGGLFGGFFPFGNSTNNTNENNQNNTEVNGAPISTFDGNRLQKLTSDSVVGYIGTSTENGFVVRYMDRASGNIFDVDPENLTNERISNTTWPRVHDMVWHRNAENFIFRFVNENDVIKTYQGSLVTEASSTSGLSEIVGDFLSDGITEIVNNKENTEFVYLQPKSVGVIGYIHNYFGDTQEIFSSQFNEWDINWINNDTITATTYPSYNALGYIYSIDINTGLFKKIFGSKNGLTTLANNTGDTILFGENSGEMFSTNLFFTKNRSIRPFPVRVIPEKCVWDPIITTDIYCALSDSLNGISIPDDWYKGKVSFNDTFMKIDVKKNNIIDVLPLDSTEVFVDVINPSITEDGKYFLFINKKDSTLWSLELDRSIVEEEEVATSTTSR